MKITITGRQMTLYDEIKNMATKKLVKLEKYFSKMGDDVNAIVRFSKNSKRSGTETVEVTIIAHSTMFRAEVSDETFRNAMDTAVDIIDRQIRKNKTKLEKRKNGLEIDYTPEPFDDELTESTGKVVKRKEFAMKPISVEEAILQMNLIGHKFFMFKDSATGKMSTVYVRDDGDYGLITAKD